MEDAEIVSRFLKDDFNLHPSALQELRGMEEPEIEEVLSVVLREVEKPKVVTPEYLEALRKRKREREVEVRRPRRRVLAEEYEAEMRIRDERDVTHKSFSEGNVEGFVRYFNDRYERLARILRERDALRDAATIEWIKGSTYGGEVRVIGMVVDIRRSKRGNIIVEVEDPTGTIPVIILSSDPSLMKISRNMVRDEVIGVIGKLGKDSKILIAGEVFFPDLPVKKETKKSEAPIALAMISDIHTGSTKFLEEVFLKFTKWLRGELGSAKQRRLAEKVKYLIVGGDLVDGVGIYPGQEKELAIKDILQQYAKIASYLEEVPDYIEIIVLPGNHDAVRQAEPQPAIGQDFAPLFYEDPRIHMVGNPCSTTLHGVEVLTYHGRSLDDIISALPGQSYSEPEKAMLELLRKRHLSPIYGSKVPIVPEGLDYMLIEEAPDIFHVGHVHHVGVENYRGVILINSGTFQEQTSFQRKLNMVPTPGTVPIVELQEQKTTIMRFM
jgi:DNA polymerase II small subunit